jgi:hypothetical protein
MRWLVASIAGLVVGGGVAGVMLAAKGRDLAARGTLLQASLVAGGDDARTYFLAERAEVEAQITLLARQTGEPIARLAAERYVSDVYGLTPDRIRRLQLLADRWT